MNKTRLFLITAIPALLAGCSVTPEKASDRAMLRTKAETAIELFKKRDPGIERFFTQSAGYAVLPEVYKGAFWIGGAHGGGMVFENHNLTGYCNMTQATIGFSFGGEFFREIIFFREPKDLTRFTNSEFTLSAQATAVALKSGAAAKVDYKDGMAVFLIADTGLMVDASVGGQKFNFDPAPRMIN